MGNEKKQLTLKERVRLVSGVGMWNTYTAEGKLPEITMTDGPHGLRKAMSGSDNLDGINNSAPATCFPTASAIAASWDKEALARMGRALAKEAILEHIALVLGPGVNMKRSPLCGRNFEYYSEDPYLAGKLAASFVRSMQEEGIGACIKHYAVNNQETYRTTENNMVDDRALREIYLKAFEIAIREAAPTSVMPSYNMINGEHGTENRRLLRKLLRDTFGFEGVTISDWGAATNLAEDIKAGLNLEMPDSLGRHEYQIYEALEDGSLSEEELTQSTDCLIRFIEKRAQSLEEAERGLGLAEYGTKEYETKKKELQEKLHLENHELARSLAEESAVLLKNEKKTLPLQASKVIVIGELAEHMRMQGAGSSHINIVRGQNAIASLEAAGCEVLYAKGYLNDGKGAIESLEEEALAFPEDLPVLYFCGLTDSFEGEGYDRKTLDLPENQTRLYEKLRKRYQTLISVTFGGSPMNLAWEHGAGESNIYESADAILHMYLGGQAVGEACTNILLGKVVPSGKLAETWPKMLEDTPAFGNYGLASNDVEYRESIFIGYRHYDTRQIPVLFPFGHGLSYSEFLYEDLKMLSDLRLSLKVKNIGEYQAGEVVQIYAELPALPVYHERRRLVGFSKVFLKPGEEKVMEIELDQDAYRIYDIDKGNYVTAPGIYLIQAASSLENVKCQTEVSVAGEELSTSTMPRSFSYPYTSEQFRKVYQGEISSIDSLKPGEFTIYHSLTQLSPYSWKARAFTKFATWLICRQNKGKSEDDPVLQMTINSMKEFGIEAIGCQANLPRWLVDGIVKDANRKRGGKSE